MTFVVCRAVMSNHSYDIVIADTVAMYIARCYFPLTILAIWVKYTYGTPTKFPELFRLQQASPELPLRPLDGSHVFFYGYFICQPLITAYSVNTSFIDCSHCGCSVTRLFPAIFRENFSRMTKVVFFRETWKW